jgi:4-aminobutyrate aminotransferase
MAPRFRVTYATLSADKDDLHAAGEEAEAVPLQAFAHGLLVLECGESTVRMSPPLVVTLEQAHTALRIFGDSVAAVAE